MSIYNFCVIALFLNVWIREGVKKTTLHGNLRKGRWVYPSP